MYMYYITNKMLKHRTDTMWGTYLKSDLLIVSATEMIMWHLEYIQKVKFFCLQKTAEVMVRRSKRHPANAMFDLKKIDTKSSLAS